MRKAQAAMEYLMTYGWAILIIIVVIAALYAMGVFKLGGTVPCSPCFGYFAYVDHNSTHLIITNGATAIESISATGFTVNPTSANPGETIILSGSISDGTTVTITYVRSDSGMTKTDSATLHG